MRLIWKYLTRYKGWLFLDVVSVSGFALAELGIPTIVSWMVDQGIEKNDPSYLISRFWLIAAAAVLGTLGVLLLTLCSVKLSTTVVYDIRKDLFQKAMQLSHKEMEAFGVSSLITRTGSDPYQIMMFLNTILRSALIAPSMLLVSVILILKISLPLSMIVLATIPIIVAGVIVVAKTAGPISERQQKSIDKINEILRENLSGIRVIRAFHNEQYEEERFARENTVYRKQSAALFKLMSVSEPLFFFLMNIVTIAIYYTASIMLQSHQIQIGQLMAFTEYLFHCMMSVLVFCMVFMMYPRANVSAKRIEAVLAAGGSIVSTENKPLNKAETLQFNHVSFAYEKGEEPVLEDISFSVQAGEKLAIIGSTGSGKSTLLKLIPRFYDLSEGSITINGIPVQAYALDALRRQIGFVSQKAHLFSGSIADNLAFGREEADRAWMEECAGTAQALSFIQERENGFDNQISEEGVNLSGGQKQRLSIARALMIEPSIYIYDDSFSALDFQTDAALRKALAPLMKEKIFIIVAQRVSTILDADKILVLDEGKLAGMGTHRELMENCEIYREIVLSQMSEEEALRW